MLRGLHVTPKRHEGGGDVQRRAALGALGLKVAAVAPQQPHERRIAQEGGHVDGVQQLLRAEMACEVGYDSKMMVYMGYIMNDMVYKKDVKPLGSSNDIGSSRRLHTVVSIESRRATRWGHIMILPKILFEHGRGVQVCELELLQEELEGFLRLDLARFSLI